MFHHHVKIVSLIFHTCLILCTIWIWFMNYFAIKMYFRVSSFTEKQKSCCVWVWVEVGHLGWFAGPVQTSLQRICKHLYLHMHKSLFCQYVDIVYEYDWDHPGSLKGGAHEFFALGLIFPQCTSSFPLSFIIAALL